MDDSISSLAEFPQQIAYENKHIDDLISIHQTFDINAGIAIWEDSVD